MKHPVDIYKASKILDQLMALSKPYSHIKVNKTPFFEYEVVISGSWKYPVLTHMTHGQRDESRVFHSKEDGKYFEYRVCNISRTTVVMECIYGRKTKKKCMARFTIKPKNPSDIIL